MQLSKSETCRWRSRACCLALLLAGAAVLTTVGCDVAPEQRWPWSTADDTTAVLTELARWRDVFDPGNVLGDTLQLDLRVGLVFSDSSSATGETLFKLAHVTRAWYESGERQHRDSLFFGVTADTVAMRDTFCDVIRYRDLAPECRLWYEYDSLWVVGFRPETIVDTTRTPPETTINQRPSHTELRGYETPQRAAKEFVWSVSRRMYLPKSGGVYTLRKTTGFRATMPDAENSPNSTWLAMLRPGRSDTFHYRPRPNGSSVNNLWPIDSLFEVRTGEQFTVVTTASTPADTVADKNRFYVIMSGRRTDITIAARRGEGAVSFAAGDTGIQHIFVEIIPWSNLLYPDADFSGMLWSIPVRVQP